jgi:manganese transport protein
MGFVGLIGMSFLFELSLADISWYESLRSSVLPTVPAGSISVIMGVLGAVVMPHTIFLHSEVVQSRQWNQKGDEAIRKRLKYEFFDTLAGMGVGWAINCAMIIMAAAVFHAKGINVSELTQVTVTLRPMFGNSSSLVFALGLLFAGLSSSIVAAMAGGSIFAGIYGEPFDMRDNHSRVGIGITLVGALLIIFLLHDPFKGILWSQIALSLQLPFTIIPLILLTSSKKVMGDYVNRPYGAVVLWIVSLIVIVLNIALLVDMVN